MSELATSSCSFKASLETGKGSIEAELSTETQPSQKVEAGSGVFFDKVTVTVASGASVVLTTPPEGAISPTGQLMAPDTIDIAGTADNITDSSGKSALQKGDKGDKELTFTFPAPNGATTTSSVKVIVEIDDAGQSNVIAL